MNRYFLFLICIPFFLTGCLRNLEKEGIKEETTYKGRVIDAQNKPLSGIMVRITNGSLIYNSVATDIDGIFQITVDITKIDKTYFIQVGEAGSLVKRSSLKGFGQDVYDYGDIPFVNINLPTVETVELTDVSDNSFTCQCEVKSQGGAIVTERGLCWSTNVPTIEDNIVKSGSGEGVYTCTVSSPTFDFNITTIYACAYAINEYGVSYGKMFKINSEALQEAMKLKRPTVETIGLTAMTATSFTCKCNVVSQGKSIVTERGICWATNIPTLEDSVVTFGGGGEGVYSCTVKGLDFDHTTYYARAYAINEYGESYGEPVEVNSSKMAYFTLPTLEYGGYTYHIHPDMGGMQWKQGYEACDNLVAYGFDDWFMPNKEEMLAIADLNILDKDIIYWTSSINDANKGWYYYLEFINYLWYVNDNYPYGTRVYHVIPVRKDR